MKTLRWIMTDLVMLVLGGLIGAGIALLVAPQSGRATRAQLYSRGVALRDKASEEVVVTRSRLNNQFNDLASGARIRATKIGGRVRQAVDHPQTALNKAVAGMPGRTNGH